MKRCAGPSGVGCACLAALALVHAACNKKINRWASVECGSHMPHALASDRLMIKGIEVERGAVQVYSADGCILSAHWGGGSNVYCEDGGKTVLQDADCIWYGVTPRATFECGGTLRTPDHRNMAVAEEWSRQGDLLARRTAVLPQSTDDCHFLVPDGYALHSELVYEARCSNDVWGVLLFDGKTLRWDRTGLQSTEARERARELVVTGLGDSVYCK